MEEAAAVAVLVSGLLDTVEAGRAVGVTLAVEVVEVAVVTEVVEVAEAEVATGVEAVIGPVTRGGAEVEEERALLPTEEAVVVEVGEVEVLERGAAVEEGTGSVGGGSSGDPSSGVGPFSGADAAAERYPRVDPMARSTSSGRWQGWAAKTRRRAASGGTVGLTLV